MKKFIAVVALSAFLFSCGGASSTESTNSDSAVAPATTAPANDSLAAPATTDSSAAPAPAKTDSSATK